MRARYRSYSGVALAGLLACGGDDGGEDTGTTGSSSASTATSTSSTTTDAATTEDSTGSTTEGSSGSTGFERVQRCEQLALSLIVDRQTPIFEPAQRAQLREFLDSVLRQTGAELIVHPNTGASSQPAFDCELDPAWAMGEAFSWGSDFAVDPMAHARLECALDGIRASPFATDADGDYMFTGLMFPIVADNGWPLDGPDVHAAMLISGTDDDEGGMYPRPGMTAEAFVRLAGGGDRDEVIAMSLGTDADEMSTFAVSVSDDSRAYDWNEDGLDASLTDWQPLLVEACARQEPTPPRVHDCRQLDILAVVDGSLSMNQEQEALIEGPFVAFAQRLEANVSDLEDYRVGVIGAQQGDIVLHTHTQFPAVAPTDSTSCGLDPMTPWIEGPSATLAEDFACLAATAASDIVETTALNAALALDPRTNPGFVRDDSLVVVLLVTDEDTQSAAATRMEIRSRMLDAVNGDLSRIVVAGVLGDQGIFEMPKTTCTGPYGTASPGRRLTSVINSFRDRGFTTDLCNESGMTAALDQVAAQIEAACTPR